MKMSSVTELNQAQPVSAQPVHEGPERGNWQVFLVDDQPRRQAWQVCTTQSDLHGDLQVRAEARSGQEESRGLEERSRCHAKS